MNDVIHVVDWSRAQFAMTAIYHWLFVPLTLGLGFICAFMETKYYRTGDERWKRTTKFWMKLFGINFAIGVATGIILEFEFGTNWSNYSYFVGDIFGAPLAIEGIMAFFLESTFIAVMFFGWNRVSKRFHLTSTWLTAIGANLSALWILVANAWMQHPVGTEFNVTTMRNEMVDFWAIIGSPVAINKFFHTVLSGYVLASVFVLGISAWFLLKGREKHMALGSMKIAGWFGVAAALLLAVTGDGSAVQVAKTQPMKLAAMEAYYKGSEEAPLVAFGILKRERKPGEDPFCWKLEFPRMLSLMSCHNVRAYVPGIDDLVEGNEARGLLSVSEKIERGRLAITAIGAYSDAKKAGDEAGMAAAMTRFDPRSETGEVFLREYYKYMGYGYLSSPADAVPPYIPLLFYSFRIMVGLGIFFILLFIVALVMLRGDGQRIVKRRWVLRTLLWSIPLAYIAGMAGWIVTEVGRQPWTIQDLLPSIASVSRIDASSVKVTFFLFVILFTALLIAEIRIMTHQIRKGPDDNAPAAEHIVEQNAKTE